MPPGEQGAGLVFSVENLALQLQIDADGDGLLAVLFVIIGGQGTVHRRFLLKKFVDSVQTV